MTTTTRFYYSSTTAAAVSPAFDADWGETSSAVRRKLKTTPAGTGGSGSVGAAETSATRIDVLNGQFVSDSGVLPVGVVAGTFNSVMSCRASGSGAADMFQQIRIHVYDSTGATLRGTLYDGLTQTTVSATPSDPNGEFGFSIQETRILSAVALTPVTAQTNDRLVIEFGARSCNTSTTSRTSTIDFRDDGVSDHPLTAGITSNGRPWVDLILVNVPGVPTSLAIDPAVTTADLTWGAPATGDPVTGYEIRLNGGSATDVGNVLAHTYTGLTASTLYNSPGAEVRAYNAGGYSSWASISFTTDAAVVEVTGALTGTGTMSATLDGAPVLTGPTPPSANEAGLVPLTVRVGNRHITREVSGLQFRKEAIGGLKSISLRLARPLDRFDPNLAPLTEVYVYDGRSAETIAQGRLTDPGRSASAGDGQQWDMVAFPPGLTDRTFPYVLIDTGLEQFTRSAYSTKNATTQSDERSADVPSLVISAEEGKTVGTSWVGDMIHRGFKEAGMKLARVRAQWDAGLTNANYSVQLVTRKNADAAAGAADTATADTAGGILAQTVGTGNFVLDDNVVSVRAIRDTSGTTGAETHWFEFWDVALRALLLNKSGTEITTGYTNNYVLADEVVSDLLGRVLDQIDGANSVVDTGGTYQIDQLAYPDGVTAEQVLADLMALEPAYRYWVEPDGTGGYVFHWEPWPTTVRYEVTLNGGGDFPSSSMELYNEVTVRWRGANGRTRTTAPITMACAYLDDKGITRSTMIDLGDEVGSAAAATRAGENFLAEHNVPANAGTITIDRPIRNLITGRMERPHEIQEAALIRVRGVESYPDALNASSNDGQTVFRIWSVTYNSDSDSAACELDIPSRSTTNALVKLAKRRNRKR